jgi:hypothetical protein
VFSDFSFALILPRPLYQLYGLSQDGFAALVIAAVAFALPALVSIRAASRATSSSTGR